ncbi:transposase, partial [Escherichia coli]
QLMLRLYVRQSAVAGIMGVVESHVNRLKMLKGQMYGRAGFELLRQRVMSPLA